MDVIVSGLLLIIGLIIAIKVFGFALSLLWTLLVGLIIGAIASKFVKTSSRLGLFATSVYGVAGSMAGKAVGGLFDLGFTLTLLVSVTAAGLLISAFRG